MSELLRPIPPRVLAVRTIPNADPALIRAYGGDPQRHGSLALLTVDQDDPTYVALDEATKHSAVEVIFARSFYAGSAHASGRLSGEILGVLAGSDPDVVDEGLSAALSCLRNDACFYDADGAGTVTVFPHVVSSIGRYFAAQCGLPPGASMAYLVAPPLEGTLALDQALKQADVSVVRVMPPPSETNFTAAWLTGAQDQCEAAARAYARTVVDVARSPYGRRFAGGLWDAKTRI